MGRGTSPPQTPPQADCPVFRLDHGLVFGNGEEYATLAIRIFLHC